MPPGFERALVPIPGDSLWFAFRGADLLVTDEPSPSVPLAADLEALGLAPLSTQFLGAIGGAPCRAADLDRRTEAPAGHRFASLRALHERLAPALFEVAGFASQIVHWDRTHQRCASCGAALEPREGERAKRCAACELDYFPRVVPAVIALVTDGPRVLMTRQARFPPGMYGLVAGFVEPGETFEACVAREVREETGVAIEGLRYFGSQPWPFPHQIMVGFTARYAGGDLVVDTNELEDARWFDRGAMPLLPPRISIARALLDAWLDGAPSPSGGRG